MALPRWEDLRVPILGAAVLMLALGAVSWLASPAPPGQAGPELASLPAFPVVPPKPPSSASDPAEPVAPAVPEAPVAPADARPATTSSTRETAKRAEPATRAEPAETPATSTSVSAPPPPAPAVTVTAPPSQPPATPPPAARGTGVRIHLDAPAADAVLRGGGSLVAMRADGLWVAAWPDGGVQRVSDVDRWVQRAHAKVVQDDLIACADPDRDRRRWLRRKLGDGVTGHIVIPAHLYDSWTSARHREPELFVRFSPSTGFVVEGA